jgi:uncharacterized protein YndB with AHSA1/START domain
MATKKTGEQAISDQAVAAKTGKTWKQWFAILDRWDARAKGHKETAKHLASTYRIGPWWSQTVTIRYEQERGLRKVGQRAGGKYDVSVQRTIATTMKQAFAAWTDPEMLARWFTTKAKVDLSVGGRYSNAAGDRGEFLAVDPPRRVRFTWENDEHCPGTIVEITLTSKGRGRTAVCVTHSKLETQADREEMKQGWSWAMDSLRSFLETGRPITH